MFKKYIWEFNSLCILCKCNDHSWIKVESFILQDRKTTSFFILHSKIWENKQAFLECNSYKMFFCTCPRWKICVGTYRIHGGYLQVIIRIISARLELRLTIFVTIRKCSCFQYLIMKSHHRYLWKSSWFSGSKPVWLQGIWHMNM